MSNRYANLRPPYPVYSSTPIFGGDLPTIDEIGPPDMRPSGLNPYYDRYSGAHGRNIAGLGDNMQTADVGIKNYPNELDLLNEADDVQGNGVFDPAGTQGNIHPDYGVFADHENLPGYLVRSRDYQGSQVIDGTTGNRVMYVPGGAVAIDQSQFDTVRARQLLWEIPPGVSPQKVRHPGDGESWIPQEASWPVDGLGDDAVAPATGGVSATTGTIVAFGIVGIAAGLLAATIWKR
jgi:hypothetical protein